MIVRVKQSFTATYYMIADAVAVLSRRTQDSALKTYVSIRAIGRHFRPAKPPKIISKPVSRRAAERRWSPMPSSGHAIFAFPWGWYDATRRCYIHFFETCVIGFMLAGLYATVGLPSPCRSISIAYIFCHLCSLLLFMHRSKNYFYQCSSKSSSVIFPR